MSRAKRSLRGQVAIVGIGETDYYKHGGSPDPEAVLALKAILAAAVANAAAAIACGMADSVIVFRALAQGRFGRFGQGKSSYARGAGRGPEWLCHRCHSFDMRWQEVEPKGVVYTIERVWHPVHPALKEAGPYLLVLVELSAAGNLRMLGNLVGDPMRHVQVGTPVKGVFEHHESGDRTWTLLQWALE